MTKKKSFRKLLAAACALTLVGGMGAAATANAASDAPWDAANATKTGSINIYKLKDGTAVDPDHSKIDPTTLDSKAAVPGAEFTVTPVTEVKVGDAKKPVDLKTFEGWKNISKVISGLNTNPEDTTLYTLDTANAKKETTGTDGKAAFTPLSIGLYKVVETKVPAGYTGTTTFFMTIPQVTGSDSATAKYNYNVNVFPKNTDAITGALGKTLDDGSFVGAGDTADYTITAATNTIAKKGTSGFVAKDFTDYAIFDDAPNAAYSDIAVAAVKEVYVGTTKLDAADYTVSTIAAESAGNKFSKGLAADHTRIIVKFTDSGMGKIATAKTADESVKVSMKVSLTLKDTLPGTVTNNAGYVPGYNPDTPGVTPPGPVTPPTPGPGDDPVPGVVTTKFGDFKIKKVAAQDNNTTLEGAEFLAFAKKADAEACAADTDRTAEKCADKASKIELKSAAGGLTTAKKVKLGSEFYVVETKAPATYVLSGEVTKVTATEASETTPVVIENVLSSDSGTWFNLPKTGAIGVGIFALLGAGLVAGGTTMHMRSRRRENA
ncbi:SpaH/EbpB family LPXTG-anchored major pilin [Propionimicrobium lymphophilum]|uniref:SpaH/EbpB family LPXTG-anchored major pilin n=1 Tax=Propionimicrobium lymphophilum TaxID=33012 RepID=UPI0023F5368E|nr:SpaH/EbpB family LPXTG-anchored major pilin [Propionimicrobium lymphophilum]